MLSIVISFNLFLMEIRSKISNKIIGSDLKTKRLKCISPLRNNLSLNSSKF